jgi:CopG family transcriptional regulator, nickel-responsive regulator
LERFTISLDTELAHDFDQLIAEKRYQNRSEAVRDLLRKYITDHWVGSRFSKYSVATLTFIFDQNEITLTKRLSEIQHGHHDLVVSTQRTYIDHQNCLETVILKGLTTEVSDVAEKISSERGVRHANLHLVALKESAHHHVHTKGTHKHAHFHPVN